jgi:carbonic anhydrase
MPNRVPRFAAVAAALALAPSAALAGAGGEWSYEGAHGPAHWGGACAAGSQQSPIDLVGATPARITPPELDWRPVESATILNNGHTIEAQFEGAGGLFLGETPYRLVQVHFHHRSEHAIGGRRFPLEAHFVHAAEDGGLAVIGVMIEEGAHHQGLDQIWTAASPTAGERTTSGAIDPRAFLPQGSSGFHYAGSLTTPPCSEIVAWTVYAQPITASAAQIEAFARVFPNNARPLQPRNRRFVLESSPMGPTG